MLIPPVAAVLPETPPNPPTPLDPTPQRKTCWPRTPWTRSIPTNGSGWRSIWTTIPRPGGSWPVIRRWPPLWPGVRRPRSPNSCGTGSVPGCGLPLSWAGPTAVPVPVLTSQRPLPPRCATCQRRRHPRRPQRPWRRRQRPHRQRPGPSNPADRPDPADPPHGPGSAWRWGWRRR